MRAVLLAALLAPALALAAGVERFQSYLRGTQTARADFEQKVFDRERKLVQESKGSFSFLRPGRFRWIYAQPYPQLIVGDGRRVWIYDEDLNQVTVKKLDAALGSSPAALLSGSNEIESGFTLAEDGSRDGLDWLQAIPRTQDSGFEKLRMAFNAQAGLVIMELNDTFGNKTVLKFSAMQRNPEFSERQFHFTPPKGADVLSE